MGAGRIMQESQVASKRAGSVKTHYGGTVKALQGVEGHVEWVEQPSPTLDVGQVRIKVAAAGLNRADLLQRAGLYPPPPGVTEILGMECSGVIAEVGSGTSWKVGDRVCALVAGGAMAEEVVVDARHVLPVPAGMSLHEAAGIPEVYATAWLNLFQLAGLKPGEKSCCTPAQVALVQLPFSCARHLAAHVGSASDRLSDWRTARHSARRAV